MEFTNGPVFHRVDVNSLEVWYTDNLGFGPRCEVTTFDWLATPTQTLANPYHQLPNRSTQIPS